MRCPPPLVKMNTLNKIETRGRALIPTNCVLDEYDSQVHTHTAAFFLVVIFTFASRSTHLNLLKFFHNFPQTPLFTGGMMMIGADVYSSLSQDDGTANLLHRSAWCLHSKAHEELIFLPQYIAYLPPMLSLELSSFRKSSHLSKLRLGLSTHRHTNTFVHQGGWLGYSDK